MDEKRSRLEKILHPTIITPPWLLGMAGERKPFAHGADSLVYKLGPFAVKVYHRAQGLEYGLVRLNNYKHEMFDASRRIVDYRFDFQHPKYGNLELPIYVNPIIFAGLTKVGDKILPYGVSAYIPGANLAEYLLEDKTTLSERNIDKVISELFPSSLKDHIKHGLYLLNQVLKDNGVTGGYDQLVPTNIIPVHRGGEIFLVATDITRFLYKNAFTSMLLKGRLGH